MTDRITQCDVVDCCEDCPRYADDCDGDKYLDRYPTMHEYAEGKRINPKLRDLISRADVYKAHEEEHLNIMNRIKELQYAIAKTQTIVGKMVESAEVKPTVIRSKTLLPTKDFKEWAKRIRETNPNAVVIPCDAEVVSADAVQGEWEFVDNEIFAGEYFCSVCGKRAEVDLYGEWILSNYCPSCGARMKGGKHE